MKEAAEKFIKNYANFTDRTTRKDFWFTILDCAVFGFVLGIVAGLLGNVVSGILMTIVSLALIVPSIALSIRRMHDINKSGCYLFMGLIPLAGPIILLVYYCSPSVTENNNFGKQL